MNTPTTQQTLSSALTFLDRFEFVYYEHCPVCYDINKFCHTSGCEFANTKKHLRNLIDERN